MMKPGEKLDETIEETFPASDAPSNTIVTGIRVAVDGNTLGVHDHVESSRFEIAVAGQIAFLQYERKPKSIVLVHTEVPPALRGRGLAELLAQSALDAARSEALSIVAVCPFVRMYLRKNPTGAS